MAEIDLLEVMRNIRENAAERREAQPGLEKEIQKQRAFLTGPDLALLREKIRLENIAPYLANLALIPGQLPPNTRFGRLKRLILRLIKPFTQAQYRFNIATARALDELVREQKRTVELMETFQKFLYEGNRTEFLKSLSRLADEDPRPKASGSAESKRQLLIESLASEGVAGKFQDYFRGSEGEVQHSLRRFLEYFAHNEPVLDLACGRGEFLELLREAGIDAKGIDQNPEMVQRCLNRGLSVKEGTPLEFLAESEDSRWGGIFGARVLDHLEPSQAVALVSLSFLKLQPGGTLVLETLNPTSLFSQANNLHLDPTTVRPYHPLFVERLCHDLGFSRVDLVYGSPVDEFWRLPPLQGPDTSEFNAAVNRLNNLLFGFQDFAVVAVK